MDRTKTGIEGLDTLVEGGFPAGRTMLLSGGCGTGKTIFSMQFLYQGAMKYKEPGIYVTLDEQPELIRQDVERFGWDLAKLEEENMLAIIDASIAKIGLASEEELAMPETGFDLDKLLIEIIRTSKKLGAKRIVIDSIPALGIKYRDEEEIRKAILKISYLLMKSGLSSIVTTEIPEESKEFGKYGIEEFVVDGVIVLHYMPVGSKSNRTLHIRKMRATDHSEDLHPIKITKKGIKVEKLEEIDFEEG